MLEEMRTEKVRRYFHLWKFLLWNVFMMGTDPMDQLVFWAFKYINTQRHEMQN